MGNISLEIPVDNLLDGPIGLGLPFSTPEIRAKSPPVFYDGPGTFFGI